MNPLYPYGYFSKLLFFSVVNWWTGVNMKLPGYKEPKECEVTERSVYQQRRALLQTFGLGGAMALLGLATDAVSSDGHGRYKGVPHSPYSTDESVSTYENTTTYNNFYELGSGKEDPAKNSHHLITAPWSISIEGECERPGVYSLEDFLKPHALEERILRLRCVEAWSAVIPWIGVSLGNMLQRFKPTSQAKFVEFVSIHDPDRLPGQQHSTLDWPYREGLRIDEAMHPLTMLAVGMYGEVMPNQNGAPLRLIVPWKYGFKSIKSIVKIRFRRDMPETTWHSLQPNEYGFYSNVNPEVSHPRWSQRRERRLGSWFKQETLPFNGYAEQVASLYAGMDLKAYF